MSNVYLDTVYQDAIVIEPMPEKVAACSRSPTSCPNLRARAATLVVSLLAELTSHR